MSTKKKNVTNIITPLAAAFLTAEPEEEVVVPAKPQSKKPAPRPVVKPAEVKIGELTKEEKPLRMKFHLRKRQLRRLRRRRLHLRKTAERKKKKHRLRKIKKSLLQRKKPPLRRLRRKSRKLKRPKQRSLNPKSLK